MSEKHLIYDLALGQIASEEIKVVSTRTVNLPLFLFKNFYTFQARGLARVFIFVHAFWR